MSRPPALSREEIRLEGSEHLPVTAKEKYRELCSLDGSIPLFSQAWWLDAVCREDNWEVELAEKGGQIFGALPYMIQPGRSGAGVTQPPLTQHLGVWMRYPESQKYATRLSFEKEIMNELIDRIEARHPVSFSQRFSPTITNWLPFYWRGFQQTTRYTYVINDLTQLDKVRAELDPEVRGRIKKGLKSLAVRSDLDVEGFYAINTKTFARQSLTPPYSLPLVKRIHAACAQRGCSRILSAVDPEERLHAAAFLVWDRHRTYYLMGGIDPALRSTEAKPLLLWNAIEHAATVSQGFDFEGSMIENIERFFRSFGAVQTPYFAITKRYQAPGLIRAVARAILDNTPRLRSAWRWLGARSRIQPSPDAESSPSAAAGR